MNCLNCANWSLKTSPLRAFGFGQCEQESREMQAMHSLSATNVCRIGKFKQVAATTVAQREKEMS